MVFCLLRMLSFVLLFYPSNANCMSEPMNKLIYQAIAENDIPQIMELLDIFDVNYPSKNNKWSLLHCATYYGKLEVMKLLLKMGANINAKDNQGKTPLVRAVEKIDFEKVSFLLSQKAKLNLGDKTSDALYYAELTFGKVDRKKILVHSAKGNSFEIFYDKTQKSANDIYVLLLQATQHNEELKVDKDENEIIV